MIRRVFLSVFAVFALAAPAAHASLDPMIEVGTGVASGITGDGLAGVDVLLRVGFSMSENTGGFDPVLGPEQFVVAKITGDFQVATDGGEETLRYLNISLVPLSSTVLLADTDSTVVMGGLEVLPMEFSRNVYIDQDFAVNVHVVGVRLGTRAILNNNVSFYTELAGRLLGYKMRSHLDESLGNFHGFSVGQVAAELGLALDFGEVGMRIFFGGDADLALGASGGNFSVASDPGVFAGLALDLSDLVRSRIPGVAGLVFFVKAAYNHSFDSGQESSVGSGVLLGGFSVIF